MPDCCSDAAFFTTLEGHEFLPTIVRLLARGAPVALEDLAGASGQSLERVSQVLHRQPGTDWTDDGRLAGFGLTLHPTNFGFEVDGRRLFTWCATDTLLFTLVLGQPAVATSTCPATGAPIRVQLGPDGVRSVSPVDAVVTQRRLPGLKIDVRADACDHGSFFASIEAAGEWAAFHPDGEVLSVVEAFDRCRAACEELGWLPAPAATAE